MIDLDLLVQQPRKTLYEIFCRNKKLVYEPDERFVLYSRYHVPESLLIHIQQCGSRIDISNSFILLCTPAISSVLLDNIRQRWSTDDCVLSTLPTAILDLLPETDKNDSINLPESFCFSPWAHLEISSKGEFKPCCVFRESVKDKNNRPYNINTDSIEKVYHSQYLQDLRQSFLKGERPPGCSNCWFKESISNRSNRQWTQDHLGLKAHKLDIEKVDDLKNLISLDIKLGNLCNFKCRVCNERSSSKIAEEQLRLAPDKKNHIREINAQGRWAENPQIWEMFNTIGGQLINIDFYGGEPFLIPQQKIFLNHLVDRGYAAQIRLHYNSNGSIYPESLIELWRNFREVDLSFSIDNLGARFELERGGKWAEVEQNIDRMLKYKLPNMVLSVLTTVSIQNVYYLDQLIDWFESKAFNQLELNMLEIPRCLSIGCMNPWTTEAVIAKLNAVAPAKKHRYKLESIIKFLEQAMQRDDLTDQLTEYMNNLDSIRNQSWHTTHREIAEIIYKGKITHG